MIMVNFRGCTIKLTGNCLIDYNYQDYSTLYIKSFSRVTCGMADYENLSIVFLNYNVSNIKREDEIAIELNDALIIAYENLYAIDDSRYNELAKLK